jgi:hypothetical protein
MNTQFQTTLAPNDPSFKFRSGIAADGWCAGAHGSPLPFTINAVSWSAEQTLTAVELLHASAPAQ